MLAGFKPRQCAETVRVGKSILAGHTDNLLSPVSLCAMHTQHSRRKHIQRAGKLKLGFIINVKVWMELGSGGGRECWETLRNNHSDSAESKAAASSSLRFFLGGGETNAAFGMNRLQGL